MSEAAPSGGLSAYTESALRASTSGSGSGSGKDKDKGGRAKGRGGGGGDRPKVRPSSSGRSTTRTARVKGTYRKGDKKSKLEFDEKARLEYLTGFHKRKLQRIESAQKKREEEAKEERKRNRRETQEARKERAAENVAAERRAYGGDSELEGSDADEEGEDDVQSLAQDDEDDRPVSYDAPEHHTTVVISEWDPTAPEDERPETVPTRSKVRVATGGNRKTPGRSSLSNSADFHTEALPPSSKRMEKKIKSSSASTSKGGRGNPRLAGPSSSLSVQRSNLAAPAPVASSISSLLTEPLASHDSLSTPELASTSGSATTLSRQEREQGLTHLSSASERRAVKEAIQAAKPFRYEGKLERAKKRMEVKQRNEKFKAERIEKLKRGGGRAGAKRGRGAKTRK